jgi:SulP family sulfate permease
MPRRNLAQLYRDEFRGYNRLKFRQDVLAGVNVAAVACRWRWPGVSGANAGGLVSAIWAGLIMGVLAGAPYQISGPTGAMSAVLILLAQQFGLPGVWAVSVMEGLRLLVIGFLRLGRFIAFIPAPVTTGFTSGIALIIAIGQLGNLLGVPTPKVTSAAWKLMGYFQPGFRPDWQALTLGGLVIAVMLLWPMRWIAVPVHWSGYPPHCLTSSHVGGAAIGAIPYYF